MEPKIKKKTAKSVTTKKKILKAKKVKKENKSENGERNFIIKYIPKFNENKDFYNFIQFLLGKVKYKKGQWNKDSKYRDQVREVKVTINKGIIHK